MTTITCDHCESEIEVAKDPSCVSTSITGHTDVVCADCRERAWLRWQESIDEGAHCLAEEHRAAYRIKRGWRA